jgi:hypothetical protein
MTDQNQGEDEPSGKGDDQQLGPLSRTTAWFGGHAKSIGIVAILGTTGVLLWAIGGIATRRVPSPPVLPHPPTDLPGFGDNYCRELASAAADLSTYHSLAAWILTAAVLIAVTYAVTSLTKTEERLLAITVVGVLGMLALNEFKRGEAAGELTAAGTEARTLDTHCAVNSGCSAEGERAAFDTCARAWSAWVKSRSDSNGVAKAALEESLRAVKADREKSLEKASQAQTAASSDRSSLVHAADTLGAAAEQNKQLLDQLETVTNQAPSPSASASVRRLVDQLRGSIVTADEKLQVQADATSSNVVIAGTDATEAAGRAQCETVARETGFGATLYATGVHYVTIVAATSAPGGLNGVLATAKAKLHVVPYPGRIRSTWKVLTTCSPPSK